MAQPIYVNVPENFSMSVFAQNMANSCSAKGYMVQVTMVGDSASLTISKNMDGLNKWLGLGTSVVVNCSVVNNVLTLMFMNEEWTTKIIALVVGWFCCLIPFITGIVGIVSQTSMPKNIGSDALMIAPQSVETLY